jgi:hypothetical protein
MSTHLSNEKRDNQVTEQYHVTHNRNFSMDTISNPNQHMMLLISPTTATSHSEWESLNFSQFEISQKYYQLVY